MRYKSIQVTSFRSIRESPRLEMDERMTVIVGQNNSGKTALLDAMWTSEPNPHRSPRTVEFPDQPAPPTSIVRSLVGTGRDVARFLSTGVAEFGIHLGVSVTADTAVHTLCDAPSIEVTSPFRRPQTGESYLGVFPIVQSHSYKVWITKASNAGWASTLAQYHDSDDLQSRLTVRFLRNQIARVRADGHIGSRGRFGVSGDAGPSSENLASALHYQRSENPPLVDEVVRQVSRIVPSVHEVVAANFDARSAEVEVRIWPFARSEMRADLAVAMERAGSGVWQVLSIVYALLTATEPKVFLIDEPNNYLHPKAVLDLIALLKSHPQHQYVIATHSPEVISACEPGIVHRVWLEDGESQFEQIDPSEVEDQRRTLQGLGVRLSAFFGADEVLWVEGPTEEAVFPKLLTPEELSGLRFLAVHDTGAFDPKDPRRVAAIYEKLVRGVALIPPAVGFLFDREDRSEADVAALKAKVGSKLELTKRRLVECYFLDLQAVADTITDEMRASGPADFQLTKERIEEWIRGRAEERGGKYSAAKSYDEDPAKWRETVDAANLLKDLFGTLTDQMLVFRKTWHGPAIVDRILKRDPTFLDPLREELRAVLQRGRQSDVTASG